MFNIPFIQIPFGYVLEFFYNFFNNYGLALILFSLAIKLILLPMSAKSKKTMMKTSRLQPKIKQIELACGDDKERYQREVQELYKEEGVSMFGGCLWSLLPLLILFPLYNVIREPLTYLLHLDDTVIEQIKSVVAAAQGVEADSLGYYWQYSAAQNMERFVDIVKSTSLNLTFLGIDLGQTPKEIMSELGGFTAYIKSVFTDWSVSGTALFPIISGGLNYLSMFVSQKMNNTVIKNDKGEKDEAAAATAQSGKMMTMLMPLISVWFGFIMPLGISIYWIAQSVFGIIQDFFLTLHYRKVYDAEDEVKRQKAAERAAEDAERERIRAAKRAANPDGITENTSKKKQQLREKQGRDAAAKEFEAKKRAAAGQSEESADKPAGGEENRPYARGRAYREDRYSDEQ